MSSGWPPLNEKLTQKMPRLLLTLGLRVFSAFGQIAITLFLLKAYDQAAVGYFAILVSNSMLASLIARQGLDRTLVLFAVRPKVAKHAIPLFVAYIRRVAIGAPLSGAINIGVYYAVFDNYPSVAMALILLLLPAVVAISFLAAGYFTGFGRTIAATIQQPGFAAALSAVLLSSCYWLGLAPDVFGTYFVITTLLALIGVYRIVRASGQSLAGLSHAYRQLKSSIYALALRYSRRYFVINFFTTFSSVYFISFLALFVSSEMIGEFKVVERLAMVIAFNLTFINIILPESAISKRLVNDHAEFDRSIRWTFLFQYVSGCGIFLLCMIFMAQIMLWMETQSTDLYVLLLSAQLVNALTGPVRVLLMYLGGQNVLQISAVLETIFSALLYWYLYGRLGLTGLGIAYFVAIALPNVVLAGIVYGRYGIVPLPFVSPLKARHQ